MKQYKIIIIEDDEMSANLMQDFLLDFNFQVDVFHTVTDGLSHIKHTHYDIVLLDLNLPDFSGLELLKMLKNNFSLSILVISAYSDTATKVRAFRHGASDYMVKPIDFEELEVRIWSLLGRHSEIKIEKQKEVFTIKENNIYFEEQILLLTNIESEILKYLVINKNRTIPRNILAKSLSDISSHRSLDHHIKNIRIKLNTMSKDTSYLKTIYGVGYKLVF